MNTKHSDGREFEADVAAAYRRLGYEVEQNVTIGGRQVDVLISKAMIGVGEHKYAIECKDWGRSVGVEEAEAFVHFIRRMVNKGQVQAGVMVARTGFSRPAKDLVEDEHVTFVTLEQLRAPYFASEGRLRAHTLSYESKTIAAEYVAVPLESATDQADDAVGELLRWSKQERRGALAWLLGEFGAGKSTVLERLKYKLALERLDDHRARIPLLVELQEFQGEASLEQVLNPALRKQLGDDSAGPRFWTALESGDLVLILDGFDEMVRSVSAEDRLLAIQTLLPLLGHKSPCIISCRPTLFSSKVEFREATRLLRSAEAGARHSTVTGPSGWRDTASAKDVAKTRLNSRILTALAADQDRPVWQVSEVECFSIASLELAELDNYLRAFDKEFIKAGWPGGWLDVRNRFKVIFGHDVELLRRPIFLLMAKETILDGRYVNPDTAPENVDRGALYEIYIKSKLDREATEKGRTLFNQGQRHRFAELTAVAMHDERRSRVSIRGIRRVIETATDDIMLDKALDEHPEEEIAGDIKLCTFLQHAEGGDGFEFVHASFYDYFLAAFLVRQMSGGEIDGRCSPELGSEVLSFAASSVAGKPAPLKLLLEALDSCRDNREKASFCLSVLLRCRELPAPLHFGVAQASNLRQEAILLDGARGEELLIASAEVTLIAGTDVDIDSVVLSDLRADRMSLKDSEAAIRLLGDSRLGQVRLENSSCDLSLECGGLRELSVTGSLRDRRETRPLVKVGPDATLESCILQAGASIVIHGKVARMQAKHATISFRNAEAAVLDAKSSIIATDRAVVRSGSLHECNLAPISRSTQGDTKEGGGLGLEPRAPSLLQRLNIKGGSIAQIDGDRLEGSRVNAGQVRSERSHIRSSQFSNTFVEIRGSAPSRRKPTRATSASALNTRFTEGSLLLDDALVVGGLMGQCLLRLSGQKSQLLGVDVVNCAMVALEPCRVGLHDVGQRGQLTQVSDSFVWGLVVPQFDEAVKRFRGCAGFLFADLDIATLIGEHLLAIPIHELGRDPSQAAVNLIRSVQFGRWGRFEGIRKSFGTAPTIRKWVDGERVKKWSAKWPHREMDPIQTPGALLVESNDAE